MTDREPYRRQLIERLERKEREAAERVEKDRAEQLEARAAIDRISSAPPLQPDDCPVCALEHGRPSTLRPVPSDTEVDLFRCSECGFEEERAA